MNSESHYDSSVLMNMRLCSCVGRMGLFGFLSVQYVKATVQSIKFGLNKKKKLEKVLKRKRVLWVWAVMEDIDTEYDHSIILHFTPAKGL